jgi:hypothetical protein
VTVRLKKLWVTARVYGSPERSKVEVVRGRFDGRATNGTSDTVAESEEPAREFGPGEHPLSVQFFTEVLLVSYVSRDEVQLRWSSSSILGKTPPDVHLSTRAADPLAMWRVDREWHPETTVNQMTHGKGHRGKSHLPNLFTTAGGIAFPPFPIWKEALKRIVLGANLPKLMRTPLIELLEQPDLTLSTPIAASSVDELVLAGLATQLQLHREGGISFLVPIPKNAVSIPIARNRAAIFRVYEGAHGQGNGQGD